MSIGHALQKSADFVTKASRWLFLAGNTLMLFLMLLVFLDVVFRRMRLAVQGGMDLMETSFCILCFFSFSFAWVKGDHIRVEILLERASPRFQKGMRLVSIFLGLMIFGSLAFASFRLASASFRHGDTTMDLGLPHGLPQTAMVIGSAWFCLQFVVSLLYELGIIRKPRLYD
ncbi:MAG: TRAP transporter small permease [Deltaproteobacteria bacterium]|nr:TRAP transporter small permease [Deltaproteobacteria bacterium]